MTAEGTSVNHSFTVRIPDFVNKAVNVRDISGTTIGSYTASGSGEITFSAPLGSLHTFVITPTSLSPDVPIITSFDPSSPVINIVGDSMTFNITLNQPVNMTWYINGIPVKSTEKGVISAIYTNTSAEQGTWIVNATASNANGSASREWTWTVNAPSASGAPIITGSAPESPINDIAGATRSFNITVNQAANVTWYINGTIVKSNETGVTSALYANTSASQGTWIVNATATNINGTVSKEWTWIVTSPLIITIISPANNSENRTGDVRVTVNLSREGTARLNWNGVNESMDGAGTSFYKNKTNLLSGNYTFRVFANDSYGSTNSIGTRTVIVNLTNTTNLSSHINQSTGNLSEDVIMISPSGNVTITIFNTTIATVNGTRITNITIDSPRTVPYALTDSNDRFIGENLTLGPDGAVFNPVIRLNFSYNDSQLGNIPASRIKIKFYNNATSRWDELTTTINQTSRIATATTTHFTTFALTGTPTPASNQPSSGGSSGSSGGGGGGSSGENYTNIELIEKYDLQISKDALTSYRFTSAKNPIMFANITGNTSFGIITASIEVLKGTSSLVKVPPEGLVYTNANIWVGTTGFATPKNIKEALIKFRIDNAWMSANGVLASDIVLMKWDGTSWINLDTKVLSKDDTNTYFEGKTNAFSPFAIVAKTAAASQSTVTTPTQSGTPVITATATPVPTKKAPGFGIVLVLVGLTAVVLRKRSW